MGIRPKESFVIVHLCSYELFSELDIVSHTNIDWSSACLKDYAHGGISPQQI